MTEEDQHIDENEDDSTLGNERDSEEASEFDELFKDSDSNDLPTREEYNNLVKGTKKLASELGRLRKERDATEVKTEIKTEVKTDEVKYSSVLKRLYEDKHPEIKEVWDEVLKETPQGQDPIEYYEGKKGWQLEAKARYDARTEDEANKEKIRKPSNGVVKNTVDVSKVKPEEVEKLKPSEKMEWLKRQAELERNSDD
jgi:hypothetical protein